MNDQVTLTSSLVAFCAMLRGEHGFAIGPRELSDALRALETVGVAGRSRVRSALRLVCCTSRAEVEAFDRAFDAFFDADPPGIAQTAYAPRHTRPGREVAPAIDAPARNRGRDRRSDDDGHDADRSDPAGLQRAAADALAAASAWQALRERYSPAAARGRGLALDRDAAAAMRPAAQRLVRGVRLGRSRRWQPATRSGRFDIRRTIRASLATGGEPFALRFSAHPHRNPRFVVLIDGSRSMAEHAASIVAFAAALCDRTPRADAFFFSTALRDATRALRAALRGGPNVIDFGEAWGGGTKIGANLTRFIDAHGTRLLSPETVVMVFSDGLDAGDIASLERALREIDRRSAGIVWLNPHAATPGFAPKARAMRAALPYLTLVDSADDAHAFLRLAERIAAHPRIRGRRR